MSENQPSHIRVSDTEREDALTKLGEHMSAGRLDLEEYGERTAKVAAAKTRGELLGLFNDLPEPKPAFGQLLPPTPPTPPAPKRSLSQRAVPVIVPIVAIVGVVALIALVKLPFFIIFPAIFFAMAYRGGHNNRHYHRRWRGHRY